MKVVEIVENPEANESFVDLGDTRRISYEDVAFIALEIGEHIQRSGGEIGRVEDTIKRICRAYGAIHVDAFALTSIIILSVNFGERTVTRTRRISKGGTNNFSKLANLNQLSREVCATCPSKDEVIERMQGISERTKHSVPLFLMAHVLTALGFCMYFGGNLVEAVFAGVIALLMYFLHKLISGPHMNVIMAKLIICFFGGVSTILITFLGNKAGLDLHADLIMIGTIMNVIPGVAFTNSLRDLLGGDLMTGILRFSEVLIDTVAIAGGYAMSLLLLKNMVTTASAIDGGFNETIVYRFIGAMICTFGLAFLYNLEWRSLPFAMLGAAIACLIFEFRLKFEGGNYFVSALLASMAVAAYSDIIAHVVKTPTTIFLIPGIVPMVPGGLLFNAMLSILDGNAENASAYGSRALFISLGITIGILAATFVFRTLWSVVDRIKHKKLQKNT